MKNDCIEVKSASGQALPRDYSRFKKLHANGRAEIRAEATEHFGFISTVELVNELAE
ncbi:hypothetical protein [Hoeflea sp.]|uniref:hypothetical protein n=1 Tax=Hoeflea sp. TaxID=1940281 RepID=UPI00374802F7